MVAFANISPASAAIVRFVSSADAADLQDRLISALQEIAALPGNIRLASLDLTGSGEGQTFLVTIFAAPLANIFGVEANPAAITARCFLAADPYELAQTYARLQLAGLDVSNAQLAGASSGSRFMVLFLPGAPTMQGPQGPIGPPGSISQVLREDGTLLPQRSNIAAIGMLALDDAGSNSTILDSGVTDLRGYGATGDGATDDRAKIIDAANAALATGRVLYFPPGTYRIASSLTLNVPLRFATGAKILVASGQKPTLGASAEIQADEQQIFDFTPGEYATPPVEFATTYRFTRTFARWYGVVSDAAWNGATGTLTGTDNFQRLQAAVNAIPSSGAPSGSGMLRAYDVVLSGHLAIGATITINRRALRLVGSGWHDQSGTVVSWIYSPAGSDTPMFRFLDSENAGMRWMMLIGNNDGANSGQPCGIELYYNATGPINHCTFEYVRIGHHGTAGPTLASGYDFTDGIRSAGIGSTNDFHTFRNVIIRLCKQSCILQQFGQNGNWGIEDCVLSTSTYGLRYTSSVYLSRTFFHGNNTDIYATGFTGSYNKLEAEGIESEGSEHFLNADGSQGPAWLHLRGGGWAYSGTDADPWAISLTSNQGHYCVLEDFIWVEARSGAKPAVRFIIKPAVAGQSTKEFRLINNRKGLPLVYDLAQSAVGQASRILIEEQNGATLPGTEESHFLQIITRSDSDVVAGMYDLPYDTIRLGKRTPNKTGFGTYLQSQFDVTFDASGPTYDGATYAPLQNRIPAGAIVLGVTLRRDISTPLAEGQTVDLGISGGDAVRFASQVPIFNTSADFSSSAAVPYFTKTTQSLIVTSRISGAVSGDLNGKIFHFTVHYMTLTAAPL